MLNHDEFRQVVQNAPLFAMDLVILNKRNEILVGLRKNPPAQGYWFVPGGRVFKGESLDDGFVRIALTELNQNLERVDSKLLGLYEHFYDESIFGSSVSTHYINATHLVRLVSIDAELPIGQHEVYRWVSLDSLNTDPTIHQYSKVFLPELLKILSEQSS
ncbi:GDP-mannose mannosyl hydrolase [Rheinheimera tangshanensis]|uniref:NUDIX domain-containing protein n=1 Tax=Rheinheimera tangshanensis TaxID=400153 RepID=A0A5C8LWM6_9GAMM|nr:NUDIX domain-containing protein [Rheinheimera tangshanensis]TXK80483.1 NUDIX domain-containing protein [Rheinheimera tangshanensis]GGM60972.1 GDP-mannose mannosyl hydrolase [Rheinheimera tangshanensis]